MRRMCVVALVGFAFNACTPSLFTNATDKQTILNLDRELASAVISGKCDVLDQILADDYLGTSSDGSVSTKPQVLDSCKSLATLPESIRPQPKITADAEVRLYQNVGVVAGKQISEQEYGRLSDFDNKRSTTKIVDESRFTKVWVKTRDRWQLVLSQTTLSAPDLK